MAVLLWIRTGGFALLGSVAVFTACVTVCAVASIRRGDSFKYAVASTPQTGLSTTNRLWPNYVLVASLIPSGARGDARHSRFGPSASQRRVAVLVSGSAA